MADKVAKALAALLTERADVRGETLANDELVFPGAGGPYEYQDGSALRRRYIKARDEAGLRPLRFHDLRHVFGSLAIRKADIVQVQEWMGHADVETTLRYLHYKSSVEDAKILDSAFAQDSPELLDPLNRKVGELTVAELEELLGARRED
jgi:integrase